MIDSREVADFRSDTVTKPGPGMRAAMAEAEVGDDVLREDPSLIALEREAADYLGKEAALFVPSGTMANQVAVHVHCRSGDEVICDHRSHMFLFEGGGIAGLSGAQPNGLPSVDGFPAPQQVRDAFRSDDVHHPRSRLLCLENTHSVAGGRVLPPVRFGELVQTARDLGLLIHLDGARLVNAAVASDCSVQEFSTAVDSVSLCLSKGLGAPVGSILAGDSSFVHSARRARKTFGGGMRQAGILAAAGLMALREGPALLALDHQRARRIAEEAGNSGVFDVAPAESNMVMLKTHAGSPEELVAFLASRDVLASVYPGRQIRLVTHQDLQEEHVQRCCAALAEWAAQRSSKPK
ncbi:MAG: threonine aldolase family protein [Planctomycetota bacterium]|jgi:threonine aldolase